MFEHVIFKRHPMAWNDWYIECVTEVGITYGIGESSGVSVGATYPTNMWKPQFTTMWTHIEDPKWWHPNLKPAQILEPLY